MKGDFIGSSSVLPNKPWFDITMVQQQQQQQQHRHMLLTYASATT